MSRVLVTRPDPGATRTAERLKALGFEPVVLPLTETTPVRPFTPPRGQFGAVAASSPNAVRYAPSEFLRGLAGLPVFAVGEATGAAVRDAGLGPVDEGAGDARGLVERITGAMARDSRVLLLCGKVRRDVLEEGLAGAGLAPVVCETYDTRPLSPSAGTVEAAFRGLPVDAALFYSAFAAQTFSELIGRAIPRELIENACPYTLSPRIAEALPRELRSAAVVAREPNEAAMLSLLESRI